MIISFLHLLFYISVTGSFMPSTSSFTTRSSAAFIYGVGAVTVTAIRACVFFAYNKYHLRP